MQAISKRSEQTEHMRMSILGFASRTYHTVENFMIWLTLTS